MASYTNYTYVVLLALPYTGATYHVVLLALPYTGAAQHVVGRFIIIGTPSDSVTLSKDILAAIKVSATKWDTAEALFQKVYNDRWCPVVACYTKTQSGWRQT